jgi:hypothetical protein
LRKSSCLALLLLERPTTQEIVLVFRVKAIAKVADNRPCLLPTYVNAILQVNRNTEPEKAIWNSPIS